MQKRAKVDRQKRLFQAILLLLVGILCLTLWGSYKIKQANRLAFVKALPPKENSSMQAAPKSIEIIPLAINLSIAPARVEGNSWEINETGASYLTSSARVKERGNIVIYGHNKAQLFGPLTNIKVGYPITLKTREGKIYSYAVYKIETVSPEQVEVLASKGKEELTLYTCTGFADSKRLVVKAKPI